MLFYCWGPRDLERDAEAVDKAPDSERRAAALQALRAETRTQPPSWNYGDNVVEGDVSVGAAALVRRAVLVRACSGRPARLLVSI